MSCQFCLNKTSIYIITTVTEYIDVHVNCSVLLNVIIHNGSKYSSKIQTDVINNNEHNVKLINTYIDRMRRRRRKQEGR